MASSISPAVTAQDTDPLNAGLERTFLPRSSSSLISKAAFGPCLRLFFLISQPHNGFLDFHRRAPIKDRRIGRRRAGISAPQRRANLPGSGDGRPKACVCRSARGGGRGGQPEGVGLARGKRVLATPRPPRAVYDPLRKRD